MTDRAAGFLGDILASGTALRGQLAAEPPDATAELLRGRPVVLAGMGSSRFAALEVLPYLRAARVDAHVGLASTIDVDGARPGAALIAISSSGRTREVVAAAERWPGPVVAVTTDAGSPLASLAASAVLLVGVAEAAGIACQSYRATIATLLRIAHVEAEASLQAAADAIDELIAGHADWMTSVADILDGGEELHLLGSGRRQGTLEQGALMLREAPRIPALPFDTADWLHVGLYTMLPLGRALLLTGTDDDDEVVSTIAGRGGSTVALGEVIAGAALSVPLPPAAIADRVVRSLVEPVALELIAAELWSRASAAG